MGENARDANLVIHEYFFLDLKVVWSTVKDDLPRLKQQIDELLDRIVTAKERQ
jgi:uncharacterized protein with HEPN domain